MSDLLFSTERVEAGRLREALSHSVAGQMRQVDEYHGEWGSLAVLRACHDAEGVVAEADGRLSVLIGDPLVRRRGAAAPWFVDDRRAELHRLAGIDDPLAWDEWLDGHFALFSVDLRSGRGRIVTDIMAHVPVFSCQTTAPHRTGLVLGTHAAAVARAVGCANDLDLVTAAELVLSLRTSYPHTLYTGIQQVGPGACRAFGRLGWEGPAHQYWAPREAETSFSPRDAGCRLQEVIQGAVHAACDGVDRAGLLLSGGEDSRVLLALMDRQVPVSTFTYAASPGTHEARLAGRVAERHGTTHHTCLRAPDHYWRPFSTLNRLVGGHSLIADVHGFGFHEAYGINTLPVVMGGLSANVYFKGSSHPRGARSRLGATSADPLRPELVAAVWDRKRAFRDWVAEVRPRSATEWMSIYPFSARKHGGVLHGNRRLFRSFEPFHANEAISLAAEVPPEWKRGGWWYRRAFQDALRATRWLPHANGRFPSFGPVANMLLRPMCVATRATLALARGRSPRDQSPWPRWRNELQSPSVRAIFEQYPFAESRLRPLFQPGASLNLLDGPVAEWPALRRLMLLQLSAEHHPAADARPA